MDEKSIEEMSIEELEEELYTPRRYKYKPGMYSRGEKFRPSGFVFKDYYKELEESAEPEESIEEKYIRRLQARGGYTRETARKALLRHLFEHREREIG